MLFDLVFEGGGVRGVAFIGALEALTNGGHTIGRVMGTSVGGLTAALLVTGHDAKSIGDLIFDPDNGRFTFADILKPHPEFTPKAINTSATRQLLREIDVASIPNFIEGQTDTLLARFLMQQEKLQPLFAILEHMSMNDDKILLDWLTSQFNIHANGKDWANLGLAALYAETGKSLMVIASDISDPAMLVLNHTTAPNLPLKWAIRMTMGVPYLFPPVIWQPEWGFYNHRRMDGHLIVDGALLSQFPIELFLSDSEEIQAICGPRTAGNNIIGLLLDEQRQVPGLQAKSPANAARLDSIPGLKLSRLLLNTLLANPSAIGSDTLKSYVLHLPVRGVQVYDFEVTKSDLQPVLNAAYNAMHRFLSEWQTKPHKKMSNDEEQYVNIVTNNFINHIHVGNIENSQGIAIGTGASVNLDQKDEK